MSCIQGSFPNDPFMISYSEHHGHLILAVAPSGGEAIAAEGPDAAHPEGDPEGEPLDNGRGGMAALELVMEEQRKRRSELGEYIDRLKV